MSLLTTPLTVPASRTVRDHPDVKLDLQPAAAPGSHGFVADMDVTSLLVTKTRCLMRAPLTSAVASSAGAASVGMIATLVDIAASEPALAASRPDWTATQDLGVHSTNWLVEGPVIVDSRLVRVGKKAVVVAAEIYDGHGLEDFGDLQRALERVREHVDDEACTLQAGPTPTLAGRALVTFARIPGTAASGMDSYDPAQWLGQLRRRTFERAPVGTLHERMGLRTVNAARGVVELELTRYVANSIGTINGGAQAILFQAAAEALRPGLIATDLQVHYLSQVKVGPARTLGRVSRDASDHSIVSLELVDAGHHDQQLALATVTLQRPPGSPRLGM